MADNNYNEEELPREKTDLFLENNMDEMLRYKNYELGYKIFRNYFTAVYAISIIIAVAGGFLKNIPLAVAGILLTLFTAIFRIVYAAKAASQGIMNPTYASSMTGVFGKMSIYYLFMAVVSTICAFASGRPYAVFYIIAIITSAASVLEFYFAKKNMKVLEKMLNEDSEE